MIWLWQLCFTKARAALLVMQLTIYANEEVFNHGFVHPENVTYLNVLKQREAKDVEIEILKQQKPKGFIIDPAKKLKVWWDNLINVHLLYTAIVVPYVVAFSDGPSPDGKFYYDLFVDCCFLTDVLLTFYTGYIQGGVLVTEKKQIAKRYCKGWFWIDLVTSIPF